MARRTIAQPFPLRQKAQPRDRSLLSHPGALWFEAGWSYPAQLVNVIDDLCVIGGVPLIPSRISVLQVPNPDRAENRGSQ